MRCPFCRSDNDRVIDSRQRGLVRHPPPEGMSRLPPPLYHLRANRGADDQGDQEALRVPFEREKIKSGIEKACWKRPVSDVQIEALITDIENDILANFDARSIAATWASK